MKKLPRSPWTFLMWPLGLLATLFVAWLSGFVYWQIRISGAIAELKRNPGKYETQLFYADPDLLDIGSRGIPRMLRAWEDALDRGDADQAFAFACGVEDLHSGAEEISGEAAKASGSYARLRPRPTMAQMREFCRRNFEEWPGEYEGSYAPWWKWWKGHRGRRE